VGISTPVTAGVAVMAVSPTAASPAPVLPSYSMRWPFDEMGVRYESGHNKPGIVRTELRKGSSEDGSANEVAVGVQKGGSFLETGVLSGHRWTNLSILVRAQCF
jgi:hypothetical protein